MLKHRHLLPFLLISVSHISYAFSWNDLWLNPNQQGSALLKANKPLEAASKFQDPQWKGVANYKSQQYEQAYQQFQQDKSANGYYNQGNALAYLQKYPEAIAAYEESLKKDPKNSDAKHNIEVLKKLQDKQKQSQDKQDDKQQNKDNNDKNQDKQQDKQNQQNDSQKNNPKDKPKDSQSQNNQQQQNQQNKPNEQDKQNKADNKNQPKPNNTTAQDKQADANMNKPQPKPANKNQANPANLTPQQLRQQQEMNAALAQIPDDPGGLLRNKFIRDYQQEQQGNNQ